jgi:AAA+ superfamily predicted ATPase
MKKETTVNHLLECIERISETAHSSKFTDETQKAVSVYVKELATYLGSTERQARWFAILFSISLHRPEIDLEDISSYLQCSILTVFKYINDFDELIRLRVIRKSKSDRRRKRCPDRLDNLQFYIPTYIIQSISAGDKHLPTRQKVNMTVYEFLDTYSNLLQERDNELLSYEELVESCHELIAENRHLALLTQIKGFKLQVNDVLILLYVCSSFTDYEDCDLILFLKTIFTNTQDQMKIRREFIKGENRLQQLKLVDSPSGDFRSDRSIVLTEYAKELFFGADRDLFATTEQKRSDIILSSDIITKKLFFNKKEEEQMAFLTHLLKPENHRSICSRMRDMGMRTGFTILLYGEPGTGKTESCLQISNQTGRDIFKISIENTKSKWFGDSEKLIKGIFDRYSKMVETYDLTPILFLNECDGILGKRQAGGHSSVAQTENAMQNLLLENMERFDGILVATTNLTENLDKAFERRFLYKIELKKPDNETRCLIWRDKIPGLTDSDYKTLSDKFVLSGGQIENISRKYVLRQILTGEKMNLCQIMDLCNEEFLDKTGQRKRIGFGV